MKKLLFILILCPFLTFPQSAKKYPSLLWKISGNGLKKPSYLYGTMHVSNRVAYHLSEQFFDALKSVEVVGLETNPGEWMQNMDKTGELSQQTQFSGNYGYGKNFYKSTFDVSFPDKRMLQGILSYDPDIINGLLYRHNRSRENFEENTYIDLFIFQTASKLNKQVISLEDFVQSEIKARLSSLPDEENNEEEYAKYKDFYASAQKIEDAYRDGNLDALDSLSKLTSSRNTQKYLINDRNVFFVNTIDSVLKTKSIFSGVGAAHLPGEEGVIELLRKKGYTVEPITPKNSKKSDQVRDELDAQTKAVTLNRQVIGDSLFSVAVPGKLSQIVDFETVKYFMHADMVNGSFYTIVRMKYFGPLFNVTAAQMLQKVDSMLFEYIPGKIVSKKEITSNTGIKGLEVVNKTRRGDEQHYQIYFTDLEMIMFKLGGKMQYASGNEAKQFFSSIQFQNKNESLAEFSPKTKGFTVKVPASFSYVKNSGSSATGLVEDLYAWQKSSRQFYGIKHAVYNDFDYLEEDTFELNLFSKYVLKNFKFTESVTKNLTTSQGFPCAEISGRNKAGNYFYGKLYIKGIHYYLPYFISAKESGFENEFFKSFKLTDFISEHPLKEITDKDFHFKAMDEVTDNSLSRFNESYAKAYDEAKGKMKTDNAKPNFDFDYKSSSKSYYSPSSNEYVNIVYEKYNDYDYRSIKDIEDILLKNVKNVNSLHPTKIKTSNRNGLYTFQSTLKDTATSRAIEFKMFLKGAMRYEISVPYDTTIGLRNWAKGFFDSFSLTDTVIGKNVLENKFGRLLDDLTSSDTLIRRQANTSIQNSVGMQRIFLEEYLKLIGDSKKLGMINEDSKAQLFVNGGTIESEKIIEPYKNLYKQYTDSFYLQLCMLKGLAYLKTQNSYNTFYHLLMNEVPLVGAEGVVSDVFSILHDSLELCRKFYPGILTLTKFDEYKSSVYALMANLVNKGVIAPAAYAAQKENILADATLAIKRYNPNNKTQSDYGSEYMDKVSREIAESIQANLEGLTNNNMFRGTDYLKSYDAQNRHELVNYAIVLSPFYRSDEKVKQFFTRLVKVKAQNIAMPVLITLLKQNVTVNDTLLDYYCRNKHTRAFFYTELEKEKMTEKFNKNYLTQESLIESVLSAQRQLTNLYAYEKDKKSKDSLVFLRDVPARNKYQTGRLHIYKVPRGKFDDEQWAVAFVSNSKQRINPEIEVVNLAFTPDKNKSEQENLEEVLSDFYITYRKRAASTANGLYYPGAYE
jgi:uncharacterized protein YbaP (TraB family)